MHKQVQPLGRHRLNNKTRGHQPAGTGRPTARRTPFQPAGPRKPAFHTRADATSSPPFWKNDKKRKIADDREPPSASRYPRSTANQPDTLTQHASRPSIAPARLQNNYQPLAKSRADKLVDPDVHRLHVATPDHMKRVDNRLYLFKFNLADLNTDTEGKRIGILGASGSGKSRLAVQVSRAQADKIPVWSIFNASEPANHMYTPHVENEAMIHDIEDPKQIVQALTKIKHRQIKRCKSWHIPGSDPPQYDPDPSIGIILDDMGEDPKVFNDPIFGWLYSISRNFKVWVCILLQYWYQLQKRHRRNLSHLFVFFTADHNDIKQMHKEYCSFIEDFTTFKRIFMLATANRGTLVIDISKQTANVHEKLFWFRHDKQQPPFKYGASWFNHMVRKRYDPDWEKNLESKDLQDQGSLLDLTTTGLADKPRTTGGKRKRAASGTAGRTKRTKTKTNTSNVEEELQIELV